MRIEQVQKTRHLSARNSSLHLVVRFGLSGLMAFLIFSILAGVTLAQQPRRIESEAQKAGRARRQNPEERRRSDQHPHAPGFFKRLRELPPDEQERVMANDERFQRLPPERQAIIRRNLERWNRLTPRQKEQVRERQEILESLSPVQRREARGLFPQYNYLSPDRKQAVRDAFLHARGLPPRQRERFLASPEVVDRFSPSERRLLRGLTLLLPDSPRAVEDESNTER